MTYKIKLEVFEGPLDLLLYLIKKNEVDIYNIPISGITEQYLEYLGLMQLMDLNLAGEFLVVAAELMQIKSKMLLPPDETTNPEEEELDPRAELVRKLIEYRKIKEAAGALGTMESQERFKFKRVAQTADYVEPESFFEVSLFELINAFSKVLKEVSKDAFYEVIKDEFTVEQKIHDMLHLINENSTLYLSRLFGSCKSKVEIIATFLATLELIRLKEIIIVQRDVFGEIEIMKNIANIRPQALPPSAENLLEENV